MDSAAAISTMVDRIVEGFAPERIILFGSHARGNASRWSDIDLLVVMDDVPNHHDTTVAILRKLSDLPVSKDIVVTTPERLEERSRMVGTVHRAAMLDGKTVYARQG